MKQNQRMTHIFKTSIALFDQLLIYLKEQRNHSIIQLVLLIYFICYEDAD